MCAWLEAHLLIDAFVLNQSTESTAWTGVSIAVHLHPFLPTCLTRRVCSESPGPAAASGYLLVKVLSRHGLGNRSAMDVRLA